MCADPRGVMPFKGGEGPALARLKHYLWDADCLGTYFETRGCSDARTTSQPSAWRAAVLAPDLVSEGWAFESHLAHT